MPARFLLNGMEGFSDKTSKELKPYTGTFAILSTQAIITASVILFFIKSSANEKAFIPDEQAVETVV